MEWRQHLKNNKGFLEFGTRIYRSRMHTVCKTNKKKNDLL